MCPYRKREDLWRPGVVDTASADRPVAIGIIPCAAEAKALEAQDVTTTMVYTPALNRGDRGVRSALDSLRQTVFSNALSQV